MIDDWVKWTAGILVTIFGAAVAFFNIRLNRAEDARLEAEQALQEQLAANTAAIAQHRVAISESLAKYPDRGVLSEMELRIRTDQQEIRAAIAKLNDTFMQHAHRSEYRGND
jgi:hypothetical protein